MGEDQDLIKASFRSFLAFFEPRLYVLVTYTCAAVSRSERSNFARVRQSAL
jgi:hypothetical protein